MTRRFLALLVLALSFAFIVVAQNAPPAADPYKPVLDKLDAISTVSLADWHAHAANIAHGEEPGLSESDWEAAKVNDTWTSGSRWLRRTIELPAKVNGYDIAGAVIDLDLRITSDEAIQVAVFSNGNLVSRTDEDSQLPILLTGNALAGQKFVIAVRVQSQEVKTKLQTAQLLIHAAIGRPDAALLRRQIQSAQPMAIAYEDAKADRLQSLDAAVKAIDFSTLDRGDQKAFDASLAAAQARLNELKPYYQHFRISAVGNSHIDMAWLWPESETVEVVRNTFASALQMMREYPKLTFSMGQACAYSWIEEKYPSMFKEIQQRVKEGRWEIVGGMWVEPDLNIPDGESLTRQMVYGKRYFRDKFGVDVKIGWNPDSFGYNWQLPQIYKRSGIDYFVTQKIYWNDTTKFPLKVFWWEAPDGSRLLTYFPHDYANTLEPVRMAKDLSVYGPASWKSPTAQSAPDLGLDMMFLFGVGDHGGGPTRLDLDTAVRWQKPDMAYPPLEFTTAGQFFDKLNTNRDNLKLPTWNDELYLEYHRGVQTTQAATKKGNRKSEVLLLNAEKTAAITTLFGRNYPSAELDTAWKQVLFNQFHDILPGSGIAVNYADAARKYAEADRISNVITSASLKELATHVKSPGTAVLVFNPLSWSRSDIVEVEAQFPTAVKSAHAIGPDGKTLLSEVLSNDTKTNRLTLRVFVNDVPAMGYKLVRLVGTGALPPKSTLTATASQLENEFLRVAIDQKTGCITSLYDKRSKTESLGLPTEGEGSPAATPDGKPCGNLLQAFVDKPQRWDAWNVDADFVKKHWDLMQPEEVKLVEKSPLRAVVRVRTKFQNSSFVQDITMYPGIARVDVRTQAEWHEKHILMKVAFPLSAKNDKATFEIPYGSIERPTGRNTPEEKAKFEVPALRWADLSNALHGFSLLNDSKYGYDAKDNVLRLSLLRSPEWPDPHADEGHHEFTYSLYPHGGSWREAQTVRQGYELNHPLLAIATDAHDGPLPASRSFFATDSPNVVITSVKKSDDDDGLTVRFYEWAGKDTQVHLRLPRAATSATSTDFMEKSEGELTLTTAGNEVVVPAKPYQIVTVKLKFGK